MAVWPMGEKCVDGRVSRRELFGSDGFLMCNTSVHPEKVSGGNTSPSYDFLNRTFIYFLFDVYLLDCTGS